MAIKILAKASLEIERAKKEEKERLPEKINELDGDIMTLMVSNAELYEENVQLKKQKEGLELVSAELYEQNLELQNAQTELMLAVAEIHEKLK